MLQFCERLLCAQLAGSRLDLSQMQLTQIHIPAERCVVSASLTVLNLDGNCFTEVPACMAQFTSLQARPCAVSLVAHPACFEHFVPAANLRCSASMTRAQELSLRKNRLIVLPIFLNSLKSLQVVAVPAVFCVHLLVSQSFTGVVRFRQQPRASARARVHAASPAQPRRV